MSQDTVNPQEDAVEVMDNVVEQAVESQPVEEQQESTVPLHALQKERRKRQEIEIENRLLREQQSRQSAPAPVEDDSQYESVTKADLKAQSAQQQRDIIRQVEENRWIKEHPELYEQVTDMLPEFLKRRPNLAHAIDGAVNRYEEAFELMDKLTPKEQARLKVAPVKKSTPGSPVGTPKAAALAETADVMSMNDAEFARWRQSRKRAR